MSWISDLAGKAENILNKIDQNAANVLQQPLNRENDEQKLTDESFVDGLKRNLSSNSLSLAKSLSPKKLLKTDSSKKSDEEMSRTSEKPSFSSRRSSFNSSQADVSSVVEQDPRISFNGPRSTTTEEFSAERELAAIKIALAETTSERDELQSEIQVLQDQLKNTSEARVRELENHLQNISSEKDIISSELESMRQSNSDYVKSIFELETNLSKIRQNVLEVTEQLACQVKETEQASQELVEYRKKAQSTLQMKEKIITQLKANRNLQSESSNEKLLNYEIDSLRQENSQLAEEIKNLSGLLEYSKEVIQKFERQINEKKDDEKKAKKSARIEQQRTLQLESEIKIVNQEITAVREEMNRQRQSFTARLHDKDNELMRLRTEAAKATGYADADGFENRMQSLTQALVQKQAAIESVTAERNALRFQLEKLTEQFQHLMVQQRQQRSQVINVNDTDDVKAQLPLLLRENPFDTNVARRVKRAYSSLDSVGIRVGVFLRRYPLIRIMVFIYVAVLHLWVMFVLLSSTPN